MARAVYLFSDSLATALRQRGRLEGSGPEHYRWELRWAGDVLHWGSAAVRALRCCQSLAKGRGLQHRLFLFCNLPPSALPCTGCGSSSRRSPGSSRGLPCVRVLGGTRTSSNHEKSQWNWTLLLLGALVPLTESLPAA